MDKGFGSRTGMFANCFLIHVGMNSLLFHFLLVQSLFLPMTLKLEAVWCCLFFYELVRLRVQGVWGYSLSLP